MATKNSRTILLRVAALFLVATACLSLNQIRSKSSEGDEASYVGAETCLGCHDEKDKDIVKTKHVILFDRKSGGDSRHECEACHGAGSLHIEDTSENVLNFAKEAAPEKGTNACLKCHKKGDRKYWDVSVHAEEDLNCTDCHQVHKKTENQLKKPQTELCGDCHKEKTREILMPSRHPVKEDKIQCASCHSPHGNSEHAYDGGSLTSSCVECHQEKAGPFVNEHEPVTESCLNCHIVHGSPNKNLIQFKQPALCLQCHTGEHLFQSGAYTSGDCTDCHTSHHGSNLNRELLR